MRQSPIPKHIGSFVRIGVHMKEKLERKKKVKKRKKQVEHGKK